MQERTLPVVHAELDMPHRYDGGARYVHKCYLSEAVRALVRPGDIDAIEQAASDAAAVARGLVIRYWHVGSEKRLGAETVRAVLQAWATYKAEFEVAPSSEEAAAIATLNQRLSTLEQQSLEACARAFASARATSGFDDLEIDLALRFYLRDDARLGPEAAHDGHDVDSDASLLCTLEYDAKSLLEESAPEEQRFGFGDQTDHPFPGDQHFPHLEAVRRTWLLHELIDHVGLPPRHCGRVGPIWVEVVVRHQRFDGP